MAKETTEKTNGADKKTSEAPKAEASQEVPSLNILAQYVKDLSFENPKAPMSLRPREKAPEINVGINVNANPMSETDFEVELKIEANAKADEEVIFAAELLYAGVFRLNNMPEEAKAAALLVECPRLIFPFAREVLANATRQGGFPPLLLDPVDFAALFQQRAAEQQVQAQMAQKAN